ncbi:MAG: DegT/DnrJ/EryC1/StrS aminotransferase family protein, partial [Desulfobulbaceae bacterium]|nr:DegT/DnrJ/EryC1/StrS aminotransferase family protein [Desulfobulbaceae bacterium]
MSNESITNVEFYRHALGEEEQQGVLECLKGLFLTTGVQVAQFESGFSKYLGLPHSVGLNSCTAALHLALLALDIGPGDEVITTPMTFIATATAILHTGAKPVFVDVEQDTGLMDPEAVVAAITPATKAILPVHLYGHPCDMPAILKLASAYNLIVIEDACQAHGAAIDGRRVGSFGTGCFSFYPTKNMTTG